MAYNSTVGRCLSHGKPNNYALNGKIMLCSVIILFLVVVLIACFHSYARWWFRRRNRVHRFFSPPNQTILPATTNGSISGNQGLGLSLLKSLPTFVYPATHQSLLDCAVCLSEFESGERGRLLPKCNHVFHVECIDMWFKSHSNCPLCRAPVEKSDIQIIQTAHFVDFQWRNRSSFETVVVVSEPADGQTGSSEVSQLEELVPVWCGRKPEELVGITVEIPVREKSWRGLEEMGRGSGSVRNEEYKSPRNGVLSLKRISSV